MTTTTKSRKKVAKVEETEAISIAEAIRTLDRAGITHGAEPPRVTEMDSPRISEGLIPEAFGKSHKLYRSPTLLDVLAATGQMAYYRKQSSDMHNADKVKREQKSKVQEILSKPSFFRTASELFDARRYTTA